MSSPLQVNWPPAAFTPIHNFSYDPDLIVSMPFWYNDLFMIGTRYTCVQGDIAAWDFWRYGKWVGPAPVRMVPANLGMAGAAMDTTSDAIPIANFSSGDGIVAQCGVLYPVTVAGATLDWSVYSCADGSVAGSGSFAVNIGDGAWSWTLPDLADGSYALWARFNGIQTVPITQAQYQVITGVALDPQYLYTETVDSVATSFFWDWSRNIGRLPTDTTNPFYALRAALVASGNQLDQPGWAQYLVSGSLLEGEWSMLRLQVGTFSFDAAGDARAYATVTPCTTDPGYTELDFGAGAPARTITGCLLHPTDGRDTWASVTIETRESTSDSWTVLATLTDVGDYTLSFIDWTVLRYLRFSCSGYTTGFGDSPSMTVTPTQLAVSTGAYVVASGVRPSPGKVLYSLPDDATTSTSLTEIIFDIAARSVTAMSVASNGNLLMGGNRASVSGPQLALWQYDGATYTLLGLNDNLSTGACECSLSSHDCGNVLQVPDGTIFVLSKCSLHIYAPSGDTLVDRLPGFPAVSNGEPGGQSLAAVNGSLYWLTEFFGRQTAPLNPASDTAQFYDTLESLTLAGGSGFSGTGCVCHTPSSMVSYRGKLCGVVQDQPFSAASPMQRLANMEGTTWDDFDPAWLGNVFLMQGLAPAQGLLFGYGVEYASDWPFMAIYNPGDGDGAMQFCQFPYRLWRAATAVRTRVEQVMWCGKLIASSPTDPNTVGWTVGFIKPNGVGAKKGVLHFCMTWNTDGYFSTPTDALAPLGLTTGQMPAYLSFLPSANGPGNWLPSSTEPSSPYLTKSVSGGDLIYTLTGTAPYSFANYDLLCYTSGGGNGPGGGFWDPEPTCTTAACAIGDMPDGSCYQVVYIDVTCPWWAAQFDNVPPGDALEVTVQNYPSIWLCLDPTADFTDLSNYNVPVPNVNGRFNLPVTLTPGTQVAAVFLWPPTIADASYVVSGYSIQPRD